MYEQDEIYDEPGDHRQQTINVPVPQDKLKVKQKLIEAFIILTQPSPTQKSLSQCHKILAHYLKRPDILQILLQLVTRFHSENETLTKLIITQIFTYMKKQSSFGYEERHDKLKIAKLFLNFFMISNVDSKFKKMTQNTFMQFIYSSSNVKIREYVVKCVQEKLTKILASTQTSFSQLQKYNKLSSPIDIFIPSSDIETEENIKVASSMIHILRGLFLGGNLQLELMKLILPNCISIYYLMTQIVTKNILIAVSSKQQFIFAQKIEECSRFTEIFILLFSKTDTGKFPTLRERFLHTKEIFNLLLVLLTLSPQFTSFDAVQKLFNYKATSSTGQIPNLDQISFQLKELIYALNFKQNFLSEPLLVENLDGSNSKIISNLVSIKKHSIQILIKCIKSLQKKKKQFTGQYQYLTATIITLWLQIKNCLIKGTQKYLKQSQGIQKGQYQISAVRKQYQDLLGSGIKYLSQVTNLSPLYNIVSPYQNQIIFQICFPWLISRQQHEKFQAEDYLFFREDIINKQNMSYIENSIGNLLESYLDNIDGAITLIMAKCTALMSYHITKNPQIKQTLNNEIQNCWALQFYSPQRQIQSALTLISVESYLSLRRNDIALILQKWLQQHKTFFLNVNNDYRITIQFLMMYSYYVDNFYSNTIRGTSSQYFEFRPLHKEVLKFCCYLMKQNYDYHKNAYKEKIGQILYCSALDCLNNSLNHTQIVPALYCNFPPKDELSIPHFLLPYLNYPFYPVKRTIQSPQKNQIQMDLYNGNKKDLQEQDSFKQILVHYRKLGLNRNQYLQKDDLIEIIEFLGSNLSTRGNIKIIQILTQMLINYIKQEMKHQGSVVNIPIVFREEIASLLANRIYSLFSNKGEKFFPNRNLFQTKATQLIYVLHSISIDPYYIYSMGMDVLWFNPDLWNFDPNEDDNNIDALLKCTDLIVRLALKHYTSQRSVNLNELLNKITENLFLYSYQYIVKIHKFNILFGILLNLILLKINPQKMLEFLYILITQKLMKAQLSDEQFDHQSQQKYSIPSSSASDILSQAFYLFLLNIYVNPIPLNTEKNMKLLSVFTQYLTHFLNAHKIVTQLGDVFGKVFACFLCIIEKEYLNGSLGAIDKNMLEFLWKNTLYSGKIYKTQLQNRVVSLKLLNLIRQIIKRNDPDFSLERVELMYQIACSCVFYSKNKDLLMGHDEQGPDQDFDHDGEQEQWENLPITMKRNESEIYIEDEVLNLKKTSRELLKSPNPQIKQWISRLIESLPVAVRNFVKNKVINYQQETKEIGLRKIIKVKRPGNEGFGGLTKQQIIKENIQMKKEKQGSLQDHIQI